MKAHLDIQHDGNLTTEGRVKMSFDQDSIAHLMSILTDLYSDPELAVIREYSTNAWDAHRAAGNTAPIEVFLPSLMNPIYRVKDYGIGMSVDEISNFFSKYGASSKRDTDDEVGMLGLGCKSGLTYTSQFTLVSVKGGVQATVLITRESDGAGAVQIMDTTMTDKPNGVEVRIPVKSVSNFTWRAAEFFSYWERGTVLVDGYEPRCVWDDTEAKRIDDDILVINGRGKDRIVMGNVAYPVDSYEHNLTGSYQTSVIVRVPIGTVNFVPSREALQYTKRTVEVLGEVRAFIDASIVRAAVQDVASAPTAWDAVIRTALWADNYGRLAPKLAYNGAKVPRGFDFEDATTFAWSSSNAIEVPAYKLAHLGARDAMNRVYVTGHSMKYVTGLTKAKLQIWWEENKANVAHQHASVTFIMVGGPFGHREWMAPERVVDFKQDIFPIEVPKDKVPVRAASARAKFRVLNPGTRNYLWRDVLDEDSLVRGTTRWTWALVDQVEWRRSDVAYNAHDIGASVVAIPRKDVKKFLAENPGIMHISTYVGVESRKWLNSLTPLDAYALNDDSAIRDCGILRLKGLNILDPEVAAMRVKANNLPDRFHLTTKGNQFRNACLQWGKKVPVIPDASFADELWKVMEPYPLLINGSYNRRYSTYGPERVEAEVWAEYVNSIYTVKSTLTINY